MLQTLNEYFSIIILVLFLEFVLVAFLAYRWFNVDGLLDEVEEKDAELGKLILLSQDMDQYIKILEKFFVQEVTHQCVVDKDNSIKFLCKTSDDECINKCVDTIGSLARHESTRGQPYKIKPMILFTEIDQLEYLIRAQALKDAGFE